MESEMKNKFIYRGYCVGEMDGEFYVFHKVESGRIIQVRKTEDSAKDFIDAEIKDPANVPGVAVVFDTD
jgi:hypothetical protein